MLFPTKPVDNAYGAASVCWDHRVSAYDPRAARSTSSRPALGAQFDLEGMAYYQTGARAPGFATFK
jgi:hypothetical protein